MKRQIIKILKEWLQEDNDIIFTDNSVIFAIADEIYAAFEERIPCEELLNIEVNFLTKNCFRSKELRDYTDREIELGQQAWRNCYFWVLGKIKGGE